MKPRYFFCVLLASAFCVVFHQHYDLLGRREYTPVFNELEAAAQTPRTPDTSREDELRRCDSEIRRSTVEKFCQSTNQPKLNIDKFDKKWHIFSKITYYMVVDDKHETIYCDVPKAASSTLMAFLVQESLDKVNKSIDWDEYPIHDPPAQKALGIRHLPGYTFDEIKHRLKNYFKFIVVRHPLERLVSAYNDKFVKTEFGYGTYYRPFILDHFRKGITHHHIDFYIEQEEAIERYVNKETDTIPESYLDGRTMDEAVEYFWGYHQPMENGVEKYLVTFSEFLEFYLNVTKELEHDHHWQAIVELCRPCLFNYDFIGKLETLKEDSYAIIKHMNMSARIRLPYLGHVRNYRRDPKDTPHSEHEEHHSGTADQNLELSVIQAFADVDPDLVDRVLDMVKDDFSAFGYSWDRKNSVSSCVSKWHNHTCC